MSLDRSLKFSQTASSSLQYKINMSIIFNYLRHNGPISRAKISRDLSISAPAVSRAVDELIKINYVLETEKMKTKNAGKRPILLKVNSEKGFVIGIDLGKEKLKVVLTNFEGKIIKKYQSFKISNTKDIAGKIGDEVKNIIENISKENKLDIEKFNAICIGVPADIDIETGKIVSAPLYANWENLNLKEVLQNRFNIPVYIENDVNLSALGEKNYGEGKNFKDMVFVEISNGVGAGIIIDNHLFRGSKGSAGEIGFTLVNVENLGFKVKNKGFLEKFSSVESIKKRAIKKIEEGEKTILSDIVEGNLEKIEPSLVCEAALKGDGLARNIMDEMMNYLSIGIINLILILNPNIIVLGGDICSLPAVTELILEPIIKKVKESIPFSIPEIKLSFLGEDAGIIGASFIATEFLLLDEFPYKIDLEALS